MGRSGTTRTSVGRRAARRIGRLAAGLVLAIPAAARPQRDAGWPSYGGDAANTRFSALEQIDTGNVERLQPAWTMPLGVSGPQESSPLVIGDTMYVTTARGPRYVYALDAASGAVRWRYAPDVAPDVAATVCCGLVNRGVAYAGAKLFFGRLDGVLEALDARSGAKIWTAKVVDYKRGAAITSPPLPVGNLVVSGYAGGEYGVRGAIAAFDQASGREVWRTYTTPAPGEKGSETWLGASGLAGGGDAWYVASADPTLGLIYLGTGNASPWNGSRRGPDSGNYGRFTNLYTASTLALDPRTGRIVWFYQETPHDVWDYDGANEAVLADLPIDGQAIPALLKADRNGFFYVLDRRDGRLISATPFVPLTWARGIDAAGQPMEVPGKRPRLDIWARDVCPGTFGAKNWQPMAYSPRTGYVYIPVFNLCMDIVARPLDGAKPGRLYLGEDFYAVKPGPGGFMSAMLAWDPVRHRQVWRRADDLPYTGGALATAGGLVFYGDMRGRLHAVDAATGRALWRADTGSGISQGPVTYAVAGRQYVAVVAGTLGVPAAFRAAFGHALAAAAPAGGTVAAFALPIPPAR